MIKEVSPNPDGYVDLAVLDLTEEDLAARGIAWAEPDEDELAGREAGPIREAFVELQSGVTLMLVSHVLVPSLGVHVRAPLAVGDPGPVRELVRALGVPETRIRWLRGPGLFRP